MPAISSLIENNKIIKSIFLAKTGLDKSCLVEFIDAMQKNKTLTLIDLPTSLKEDEIEQYQELQRLCTRNNERLAQKIEHVMRMKSSRSRKHLREGKNSKKLQLRTSNKRSSNPKMRDENIFGGLERI